MRFVPTPARGRPARLLLATLLVLLAFAAVGPAPTSASATAITPRLHEVQLDSVALGGPTTYRALLPADGITAGRAVLLLLHDEGGDHTTWSTAADLEAIAGLDDLVVVMPDGGAAGWYADHPDGPGWETFHLTELLAEVATRFGTRTDRGGVAVAGGAMGGTGALAYAARHPDRIGWVGAFSAYADLTTLEGAVVEAVSLAQGEAPGQPFGLFATDEIAWRAHNPVDLAENLTHVRVALRSGPGSGPLPDPVQQVTHPQMEQVHLLLAADALPHLWQVRDVASSTPSTWVADLEAVLPDLQAHLSSGPLPLRTPWAHVSAEDEVAVWGWTVSWRRTAPEFTELLVQSAGELRLRGSGVAVVTTAPQYEPGASYRVAGLDTTWPSRVDTVEADAAGRLTLRVRMNAASPQPEHSLLREVTPDRRDTQLVTIAPAS